MEPISYGVGHHITLVPPIVPDCYSPRSLPITQYLNLPILPLHLCSILRLYLDEVETFEEGRPALNASYERVNLGKYNSEEFCIATQFLHSDGSSRGLVSDDPLVRAGHLHPQADHRHLQVLHHLPHLSHELGWREKATLHRFLEKSTF